MVMAGVPTIHCDPVRPRDEEGIRGEHGCFEHGSTDDGMLLQGRNGDFSFEFNHHKYFHGFGPELSHAVTAARSARFEHGERPFKIV